MDIKAFEAALKRDGYSEIETKGYAPNHRAAEHAHEFDVRALVLEGEITLGSNDGAQTYRPGEAFTMPAERPHTEAIGPGGVRFLFDRRRS